MTLYGTRHLALLAFLSVWAVPQMLVAQRTDVGVIAGRVTSSAAGAPLARAFVRVANTTLTAQTGSDGNYRIAGVPAGAHHIQIRLLGFTEDSSIVIVASGSVTRHDVTLRPITTELERMTVTAQRLGESKAAALDRQKTADNIVTVLSGDEIRALPNGNAAEGAARIPGVTTERDEGEGKFIEVRGTEPRLSNVTIDGGARAGQSIRRTHPQSRCRSIGHPRRY